MYVLWAGGLKLQNKEILIETEFFPLSPLSIVLTMVVGKQPVAWKEYCGEYWLKEL